MWVKTLTAMMTIFQSIHKTNAQHIFTIHSPKIKNQHHKRTRPQKLNNNNDVCIVYLLAWIWILNILKSFMIETSVKLIYLVFAYIIANKWTNDIWIKLMSDRKGGKTNLFTHSNLFSFELRNEHRFIR